MKNLLTALFVMLVAYAHAQEFTLADTLRGALSPARTSFDVTYYHLQIEVDIDHKSIRGVNDIYFENVTNFDSLQLDLFANMQIDSILYKNTLLNYTRLYNAVFVYFPRTMRKGAQEKLSVFYHGIPTEAKNAPWDGGFVWKADKHDEPFVGVACEGTGASLWWPNKDHLSDEPDSMRISCTVPSDVMCVANGQLESKTAQGNKTTWNWKVSYPINNYNVTVNIAAYAHFQEKYIGILGDSLDLDYYVLPYNLEKAKAHFKQVPEMLNCFEQAFGPYPFYEDGYALVETPYVGMEHQGAISYGNKYMPGYLGRHPKGMDFDYIIIHETGHEWWGNSVSMNDLADMWIHESFCTYAESVFVECKYGYDKMLEYLLYQRNFINNKTPIYGVHGLNQHGNSGDMYYKGAWMIHSFRNVLNNDSLFRAILKGIAQTFHHQNIDGGDIIQYINAQTNTDYTPFFNQYLHFADVPVLEYKVSKKMVSFRWRAEAAQFAMPVVIQIPQHNQQRIMVTNNKWTPVAMSKKEAAEFALRDDLFLFIAKEITD